MLHHKKIKNPKFFYISSAILIALGLLLSAVYTNWIENEKNDQSAQQAHDLLSLQTTLTNGLLNVQNAPDLTITDTTKLSFLGCTYQISYYGVKDYILQYARIESKLDSESSFTYCPTDLNPSLDSFNKEVYWYDNMLYTKMATESALNKKDDDNNDPLQAYKPTIYLLKYLQDTTKLVINQQRSDRANGIIAADAIGDKKVSHFKYTFSPDLNHINAIEYVIDERDAAKTTGNTTIEYTSPSIQPPDTIPSPTPIKSKRVK